MRLAHLSWRSCDRLVLFVPAFGWQFPRLVLLRLLVSQPKQRIVIPLHFLEIPADDAVDFLQLLHLYLVVLIQILNPLGQLALLFILCPHPL